MKDILIITVNYKNTEGTENFVQSLEKLDNSDGVELVVVDSESTHETKEKLQTLLRQSALKTLLIDSFSNTFYWGGVTLALHAKDLDYANGPSWIIACNNDILFRQKDFLLKLSRIDPEFYPVIAPSIISIVTGKNLNPYMVRPIKTMAKLYYGIFFFNSVTGLLIYKFRNLMKKLFTLLTIASIKQGRTIYAPHGAFIIFSSLFFQKGGWLDENLTMYGEEFTVAEIARRLQLPVHYRPDLEVIHVEHSSTGGQNWAQSFAAIKTAYYYVKREYL